MEANALFKDCEWRSEIAGAEYLIATEFNKLDIDWINSAFGKEELYWARRLPREQVSLMLSQSLTLGLYKVSPAVSNAGNGDSPSSPRTPSPTLEDGPNERLQQIGMARFITDYVTFAYLTDVYVEKESQGLGLGKWLVKCCQDIMDGMPALRRGTLMTSRDVGERFYSRELGFYDIAEESKLLCMTRSYKRGRD